MRGRAQSIPRARTGPRGAYRGPGRPGRGRAPFPRVETVGPRVEVPPDTWRGPCDTQGWQPMRGSSSRSSESFTLSLRAGPSALTMWPSPGARRADGLRSPLGLTTQKERLCLMPPFGCSCGAGVTQGPATRKCLLPLQLVREDGGLKRIRQWAAYDSGFLCSLTDHPGLVLGIDVLNGSPECLAIRGPGVLSRPRGSPCQDLLLGNWKLARLRAFHCMTRIFHVSLEATAGRDERD